MEAQFWINKWKEGQIGFHKNQFNEALLKHFPLMKAEQGEKILVPLCGKSKDLAWLLEKGLIVKGVELYENAVEAFFVENNYTDFVKDQKGDFINYSIPGLTISCGDFFKIDRIEQYDLVYDRASLVALPPEMRKDYAKVIKDVLKQGGKYFLIVYEYDQNEMSGPPFSISEDEIKELYGKDFLIKLVESEAPVTEGPRLKELAGFQQKVYLLEKTA